MSKVKVSVIIAVYNTEKYLRECLDSVINQTLLDIEIICIDDGSTDGSLMILREYEARDKRIRVLTQPHSNAAVARNRGLEIAAGEYLSILDSDDFFEAAMLEDCVRALETQNADVVCFASKAFDMRTGEFIPLPTSFVEEYLPDKSAFSPEEINTKIFNAFLPNAWSKVFRRMFVEKNKIRFQNIPRSNDVRFTFSALAQADKIAVINHEYATYRMGSGSSLQQTNHATPLIFWDSYYETKKMLIDAGKYEQFEQSFLNFALQGMIGNYYCFPDETPRAAVFSIIKYRGEQDFGFLQHPDEYYYYPHFLERYKLILNQELRDSGVLTIIQKEIDALLEERDELYRQNDARQLQIDDQKRQIDNQKKQIEKESEDIASLKKSHSYRIGRFMTWFPRKLRGGIGCLREHGITYTLKKLGEKLNGR